MNYCDFPVLRDLVDRRERLVREIVAAKREGSITIAVNGFIVDEKLVGGVRPIVIEYLRDELVKVEAEIRALDVTF